MIGASGASLSDIRYSARQFGGIEMSSMRCWYFCLLALPILANAAEKSTAIINDVAYTKPQKLVRIAPDQRLNIYCTGTGSPTVVFDSGLGEKTSNWGLIQPAVAKHTRACSYDRAGLGFSDPPNRPSTSANMVDDLHRLLHAAGIRPKYILVGHSLGGMNIKLYAETYLSEVAGLVFVDPSHEDLGKGAWAIDPESQKTYAPYMEALQRCLEAKPEDFVAGSELVQSCGPFPDSHYSAAINAVEMERGKQHGRLQARISEQENVWFTSADQVRAAYRPLGAIPIIVLTHEAFPRGAAETQEQRDAKNKLWLDLHDQIAGMSTRGKRTTVENSGHYIQLQQPQIVIDAILEVLQTAQNP
jgi:pimeloyl-ACP methyl ester carboxylesterase